MVLLGLINKTHYMGNLKTKAKNVFSLESLKCFNSNSEGIQKSFDDTN